MRAQSGYLESFYDPDKKLKFYPHCAVQWIGGGFFKDNSWKTVFEVI